MMLLELSKEKHENIIQILYTFKTRAPDDRKQICHRDIKPQNILIDPYHGALKIADFGNAKVLKPNVESTPYQVTRYYRAPELLMDSFFYTPLVDVWAGGCVLGEMFRGSPLFPGRDSKHQLCLVIEALGTPNPNDLHEMRALARLPGTPVNPRGLSPLLPHCDPESIEFMQRILIYNPNKRLCGMSLLSDSYFSDLLVLHKKRHNGRLVADIPSYNEMMVFGLKNHSSPQRPIKTMKSVESIKPTVYSSQENAIADK
ncbi:Protein kinase domain-containing protein [Aphelenchoides besseyi]|nr:Protein kinase domain-containing protein [Aphelenchoides besseyi]